MTRLPNLLVPGVTKAGSTSLYNALSGHPAISGGAGKELNLLTRDTTLASAAAVAAWTHHFAQAGEQRYRLDVSPQYFAAGTDTITRLREMLPADTRVLITLRDPATRLWSAYRMKRNRGRLEADVDFEAFLHRALDLDARDLEAGEDLTASTYATVVTGRYERFLPDWFDAFGDAVRVVFFEDLAADPPAFLADILGWLGLDPTTAATLDTTVRNVTMQHRNQRLAGAARWAYRRHGQRLGGAATRLRRLYERFNTAPPPETFTAERQRRVADLYASSRRDTAQIITEAGASGPMPAWLADTGMRAGGDR